MRTKMRMQWESEKLKNDEWALATVSLAPGGVLLPNGTKLRREDSGLSHSFLIVNGRILAMSGKGVYLGHGNDAKVKLAEDESGALYALKIARSSQKIPLESDTTFDLGVAIPFTSRSSKKGEKYYLPYFYLGTPINKYLKTANLSDDQRYELGIKMVLALNAVHSGEKSKTGAKYAHVDLHIANFTINEETGNVSVIDFGDSEKEPQEASLIGRLKNSFLTFFGCKLRETPLSVFQDKDLADMEETLGATTNMWKICVFTHEMQAQNKLLYDLMNHYELSSKPMGYEPSQRSLLDVARKLTFIRFRLDNLPFYNQRFSVSETEEIMQKLNNQANNINAVYELIEKLRLVVNEPVAQQQISNQVLDLENRFKFFLIGYVENECKEEVNQFSNCLKILEQQLRESVSPVDPTQLTSIESAFDKLLIDLREENTLKY